MSSNETPIYRWLQENSYAANNDAFSTPLFTSASTMDGLDLIDLDWTGNNVEQKFLSSSEISEFLLDTPEMNDLVNITTVEEILKSIDGTSFESTATPISTDSSIENEFSTAASVESEELFSYEEYSSENTSHIDSPIEELSYENEIQEPICLSEEYQNYLIIDEKPIRGIYYLNRYKPYLFSLYYNKSAHIDSTWTLHINLESEKRNPKKPELLKMCSNPKHSETFWFSCNDMNVHRGDSVQISLPNNRINREISLKFFCNTSCQSMYSKSKLQFRIVDSNDVICFEESYNIHVSERPGRDQRDLLKAFSPINSNTNFISRTEYLDFISDPLLINKDVPKLIDITHKDCKFEVALDNYEPSTGINFSGCIGNPVSFKVTEASTPFSDEPLYLRCMIVDPKSPESSILCKNNHGDGCNFNILSSRLSDVQYMGSKEGVFADERLSILFPLKTEFSLYFKCTNACFLDRNRKCAGLIIILENAAGEMFARRHFKFAIVSRPNRNKLNYDDDDDSNDSDSSKTSNKKRKSPQTSDSPTKKRRKN